MIKKSKISHLILSFFSWEIANLPPTIEKYILVAAPHTSNWDFPLMLLTAFTTQVQLKWMGKKSLFRWPFNSLMVALGGVPIDRSRRQEIVTQTSKKILSSKKFILVIPPEGTRSRTQFWKSGFIHISREANVPIVFSYMDYKKKEIGFSEPIDQNQESENILKLAHDFYKNVTAKYPENFGPIKLKK